MIKLMYITNHPQIAAIASAAGVDRIFVDLETLDKNKRQGGMDTVQSHHTIADINKVRKAFNGELLVRTNHIYDGTADEIDTVINAGADIIMLPYFKKVEEVKKFLDCVNGRVKTMLLVETKEAVNVIDDILNLDGIDEMYIGLNDLHLSYGMDFMFELLVNGAVEKLANKFKDHNLPFGFGGIAKIGGGLLPSEHVIAEHYRLGSSRAILSRSFCNCDKIQDLNVINEIFNDGLSQIRILESTLQSQKPDFFEKNRLFVNEAVTNIVNKIRLHR